MTIEGVAPAEVSQRIAPVTVPKPAEVFADILRAKIFSGEFPTGEALPAERVLVEQSELSRATVRDALAILKQQGLIVTRAGRGGGSIVTHPTQQDLVASLDVYLLSKGWGPENPTLAETREVIEPWCAALAAARRTDADLATLGDCLGRMEQAKDDVSTYILSSQAWHHAVADASHNSLVAALMRLRSDAARSAANRERYATHEARRRAIDAHREISEHIRLCHPQKAHDLMAEHIRGGHESLMERLVGEGGARG